MYDMKFDSADAVPAELKDFVGEDLTVKLVPHQKLEELRNNNVELSKRIEGASKLEAALKPVLEGIEDPAELVNEFNNLRELQQKVEDGKLKASDSVTAEVEKRTKEMQQRFQNDIQEREAQLNEMRKALQEKDAQIKDNILIGEIRALLHNEKLGLNPAAEKAVIAEAREQFVVKDDGTILAVDKQGNTVWGPNGDKSLTLEQWAEGTLRERAPYLYLQSQGANAYGDGGKTNDAITQEALNSMSVDELWRMAANS